MAAVQFRVNEPTLAVAVVAIPSVVSNVSIAPITGLCATSSTRPLSSARNSAASNKRLSKQIRNFLSKR
jgi:hypothetical protein